jgi:predicted deacylase
MVLEPIAVQRGLSGILNYLRHRGVLRDQPPIQVGSSRYTRTSRLVKYHAPIGGLSAKPGSPGHLGADG